MYRGLFFLCFLRYSSLFQNLKVRRSEGCFPPGKVIKKSLDSLNRQNKSIILTLMMKIMKPILPCRPRHQHHHNRSFLVVGSRLCWLLACCFILLMPRVKDCCRPNCSHIAFLCSSTTGTSSLASWWQTGVGGDDDDDSRSAFFVGMATASYTSSVGPRPEACPSFHISQSTTTVQKNNKMTVDTATASTAPGDDVERTIMSVQLRCPHGKLQLISGGGLVTDDASSSSSSTRTNDTVCHRSFFALLKNYSSTSFSSSSLVQSMIGSMSMRCTELPVLYATTGKVTNVSSSSSSSSTSNDNDVESSAVDHDDGDGSVLLCGETLVECPPLFDKDTEEEEISSSSSSFAGSRRVLPARTASVQVVTEFKLRVTEGSSTSAAKNTMSNSNHSSRSRVEMCVRCSNPKTQQTRVLADSCRWAPPTPQKSSSYQYNRCGARDYVVGYKKVVVVAASSSNTSSVSSSTTTIAEKCCAFIPAGCVQSRSKWTVRAEAENLCSPSTAVIAAASLFQDSVCFGLPPNARGAKFCSGYIALDDSYEVVRRGKNLTTTTTITTPSATIQSPCSSDHEMAFCNTEGLNEVVVGYTSCEEHSKRTQVSCSRLRSGRIIRETCVDLYSDDAVWCPKGYVAVAVCAPFASQSCGRGASSTSDDETKGKNTGLRCCQVWTMHSLTESLCTPYEQFVPLIGSVENRCPAKPIDGKVHIPELALHGVSALGFSELSDELFFFAEDDQDLSEQAAHIPWSVPFPTDFGVAGERKAHLHESIKLELNPVNCRVGYNTDIFLGGGQTPPIYCAQHEDKENELEGTQGAYGMVSKLLLLSSGRAWKVTTFIGSPPVAGVLSTGKNRASPVGPIRDMAISSHSQIMYFTAQRSVFVTSLDNSLSPRVAVFIGDDVLPQRTRGVSRFLTSLAKPVSLALWSRSLSGTAGDADDDWVFIGDEGAGVVLAVSVRTDAVTTISGTFGHRSTELTAATTTEEERRLYMSCNERGKTTERMIGTPRSLAVHQASNTLFMADSIQRCVIAVDIMEHIHDVDGGGMGGAPCREVGHVACYYVTDAERISISSAFFGVIDFAPGVITVTGKYLLMACTSPDCSALFGVNLYEDIKPFVTQTLTEGISDTISQSYNVSLSGEVSLSGSFGTDTPTPSHSASISTCENLEPEVILVDENDVPIEELEADEIEMVGIAVWMKIISCHQFADSANVTVPLRVEFDEVTHQKGKLVSSYGFARYPGMLDGVFIMGNIVPVDLLLTPNSPIAESSSSSDGSYQQQNDADDDGDNVTIAPLGVTPAGIINTEGYRKKLALSIGPHRKYDPTLKESVIVVWPPSLLLFSSKEVKVRLRTFPSRFDVFDNTFQSIISYTALLSTCTALLTSSTVTTTRVSRLMLILRSSECPLEDLEESLPFSVHPLWIPLGHGSYKYHIGAAVLNSALMLLCVMCHLTACVLVRIFVKSKKTATFSSTLAFMRFPSLLIPFFTLFLQPTLRSALKVVWAGGEAEGERGERTAAAGIILAIFVITILLIQRLISGFHAIPREVTLRDAVSEWLLGTTIWESDEEHHASFVERYGSLFVEMSPNRPYFLVIDLAVLLLLGVGDAFSLSNDTKCSVAHLALIGVFTVYLLVFYSLKPIQSSVFNKLLLLSSAMEVVAVLVAALAVDENNVRVVAMVAVAVLGVVQLVMFFLHGYIASKILPDMFKSWWKLRNGPKKGQYLLDGGPSSSPAGGSGDDDGTGKTNNEDLQQLLLSDVMALRDASDHGARMKAALILPELESFENYQNTDMMTPQPAPQPLLPTNLTLHDIRRYEEAVEEERRREEEEEEEAMRLGGLTGGRHHQLVASSNNNNSGRLAPPPRSDNPLASGGGGTHSGKKGAAGSSSSSARPRTRREEVWDVV